MQVENRGLAFANRHIMLEKNERGQVVNIISAMAAAAAMLAESGSDPRLSQASTIPVEMVSAPVAINPIIAAGTSVDLEVKQDVSSKTSKPGDWFELALAAPIILDNAVIIPAGTPGRGQVVHAAKGGFGGSAGELLLAARYLDVGGQKLMLRKFRIGGLGSDNMAEAMITNAVVPIVGLLISGGNITIASGTRSTAIVSADFALNGTPSSQQGE
jgi:hypothetical protein